MLDTLFGLIPAQSRGQQWLAEELQLINWGGYDGGPHRVRFSPGATLLCGGSGSGKSTLMDAYIALMMPHTTPFNGASNGGVSGRARSGDQRNILSYGRGKIDESRTEEGTRMRVLRGDGRDTWTAVSMTWADHDGSRFTAVRAWYIPASARALEETVKVRGVVDGPFDLARLEEAAAQRLAAPALRAAGLETMATDREFLARMYSVLGIGAAGSGAKAMGLLARIQAGQQISTVDELYKRMVLEAPETLAAADGVVAHFDELDATRERMVTAQKQVRALAPIRQMRERIEQAGERLRLIDRIGSFSQSDSRAALWRHERRLGLLREVEDELHSRKRAADAVLREREAAARTAQAEYEAALEVVRHSGGGRLEAAERELRAVERRLEDVRRARERFTEATACLEAQATTEKDFAALARLARAELDSPRGRTVLRNAYAEARAQATALRRDLEEAQVERELARGRQDSIPTRLHDSRRMLAEAVGLSASELPFVGELVEVRAEFEPWREAFNLALGGFATTLLIDAAHLDRFREAINGVRTPVRLRYEGAHTGLERRGELDPRSLPGRLDYRETVFTGWLKDRLEQQFGFICVDSARELRDHPRALTLTGQVSQGGRGAHGGQGGRNVLGFSSHRRLEELDQHIAALRERSARAAQEQARAEEDLDAMEARHGAYARVVETDWAQIDVASVERERQRWSEVIAEASSSSPQIAALQQRCAALQARVEGLREEIGRAKARREQVENQWAANTDAVDEAQTALDEAREQGIGFCDEEEAYLDARFPLEDPGTGAGTETGAEGTAGGGASAAAPSSAARLERFDAALSTASRLVEEDRRAAMDTVGQQREALRRTLEGFLDAWPNPSLRADPDTSLKDFERILQDLETSGLHELEAQWRNSLLRLSGNDLTNLDSALSRARREIQERIAPVNRIMEDLPFYDDDHRLQITLHENQSEVRRRFRKELRAVRALIDAASSDPEREQAYGRMSRLIDRIRRDAPDVATLIDVRTHVRISAEKIHARTKEHAALYDHIGEKSGGESQELIAFIVGAALRYQLGDADAARPRYAVVFLDEALIKADARFTRRAIGAWRGLGFQLVIGAPNDKYSAIEPHVEAEYDILKDTRGRSWAKPKVALPQDGAVGPAGGVGGVGER
ncbi:ATP-binding protein [Actinomyces capricornis]|nr:SbcC/MukB-like Walker B domain-containing protein [Actinomyces capricornis]